MDNEKAFYVELGEKIRVLRKQSGLDQEKLGQYLGLTRTSVVNIEKGRQKISVYQLVVLVQVLKTTLAELVSILQQDNQDDPWQHKIDVYLSVDSTDKKNSILDFIKKLS